MKSTAFYVKTTVLAVILFVESFLTTSYIMDFVNAQDFFSPAKELLIPIAITLLLMLVTNALMVGSWDKWEQYIFAPIAIAAGLFVPLATINIAYAIIIFAGAYLFLGYEAVLASNMKSILLKFLPKLILRFSTRGIMLIFTILAAALVIINPNKQEVDISGTLGAVADKYLSNYVDEQVSSITTTSTEQTLNAVGLSPEQSELAKQSGLFETLAEVSKEKLDLKEIVTKETRDLIEPYKQFVNPLMALLVLGIMQLVAFTSYLGYMLIIDTVFWLARKTGLISVELKYVQQEILRF